MSKRSIETITCAGCGTSHPFEVWQSVNTVINPETKTAVRDLSLFKFVCPHCGKQSIVHYDILYHQMEDKMMIQVSHDDEALSKVYSMFSGTDDHDSLGLTKEFRENGFLLRIVRSLNQLLEKLAIFDAGLDDRIVEILKVFVLVNYCRDNPEDKDVDLLFSVEQDGQWIIHILQNGVEKAHSLVSTEFYEKIYKDYIGKLPDIRADDPIIDQSRALEAIGLFDDEGGSK